MHFHDAALVIKSKFIDTISLFHFTLIAFLLYERLLNFRLGLINSQK